MLDEFVAITGYYRRHAIRLLKHGVKPPGRRRRGRPKLYTGEVISALIKYRWEHEEVLENMQQRVESHRDKVKMRQWLSEHPFGTIKRSMNQGYLLLRGLDKVAAEVSLTVRAYNIKRVINIVGLKAMIEVLAQAPP